MNESEYPPPFELINQRFQKRPQEHLFYTAKCTSVIQHMIQRRTKITISFSTLPFINALQKDNRPDLRRSQIGPSQLRRTRPDFLGRKTYAHTHTAR